MINKPCPSCRSQGRDRTGDHLYLMKDQRTWYCTRCKYSEREGDQVIKLEPKRDRSMNKDIGYVQAFPMIPYRGISENIIKRYGIRASIDEASGIIDKVFYPYRKGYKVKLVQIGEYGEEIGSLKKPGLCGQDLFQAGGKKLLITEGEDDMLAAAEMMHQRYPDRPLTVVSLPYGAPGAARAVAQEIEWVNTFSEVILSFDQDEEGDKATVAVGRLLGPNKAKVMRLSEKDSMEMYEKGKHKEWISAFFDADFYQPAELKSGEELGWEDCLEPLVPFAQIQFLPKLMSMTDGIRKGEMTVILAPPGAGKSTSVRQIAWDLMGQGVKVMNMFLEEDTKKTRQSFAALEHGIFLPRLRKNPNLLSHQQWQEVYEKYIKDHLFLEHDGSIGYDAVMANIRWAEALGKQVVVFDHLSMVIGASKNTDERKEIDNVLTEMAAFTAKSSMHLFVVAHIKRVQPPPKKKEEKEEPHWVEVALDSARGSGAFEQLFWNIWTVEPEFLPDGSRGRMRFVNRKNREWGKLGEADYLILNLTNGKLEGI